MSTNYKFLVLISIIWLAAIGQPAFSKQVILETEKMQVGVARIDITPEWPIRLAGFAVRSKAESEGVLQRLSAKALAFGTDAQKPSVLITVDLIGIPAQVTQQVSERLAKKIGLAPERLAICASHTHSGPEVGTLLNILQYRTASAFSDSLLPLDQMKRISQYVEQLTSKLEQVALAALKDRRPALVSWGQGKVAFAENRRRRKEIVDHSMPLLKVTEPDGKLRAVLVNYSCHAVALGYEINKIHGDWVGEAQAFIENSNPGAIAMVAIGCGADANPSKAGLESMSNYERTRVYGKMIADEANRLLAINLQPLDVAPKGNLTWIQLPFDHVPTTEELVEQTKDKTVKGYYARLALERLARGQKLPSSISYPVQTWTFGKTLAMVFLGGEVVADYSLRLKRELGAEKLWINAYSNDVPCYIGSKRVINEGAYEGEASMFYYDKPARLDERVEEQIITEVYRLLPLSFKKKLKSK